MDSSVGYDDATPIGRRQSAKRFLWFVSYTAVASTQCLGTLLVRAEYPYWVQRKGYVSHC